MRGTDVAIKSTSAAEEWRVVPASRIGGQTLTGSCPVFPMAAVIINVLEEVGIYQDGLDLSGGSNIIIFFFHLAFELHMCKTDIKILFCPSIAVAVAVTVILFYRERLHYRRLQDLQDL